MKVELFGWEAVLYNDGLGKDIWWASLPPLRSADLKVLERYVMFLELVEFYLRELNDG